MKNRCRIAVYLRLSKEDEERSDESNSITNQRFLLKEFVRENFEEYEWNEFSDDGYSGTNFERPAVTEMLKQIRDGKIDCVIVKDFSRFSRDYIELGSYLDQIFPFLGVRFISLNDRYDSAKHPGNTTGLAISFQGLLYDLYAKDLSVKVKSSLHIRKEQGQYACANIPFGYARSKEDRHRLVIAEDEAEIVRRIFALTLEGKTSTEIAKLFNLEKIRTPISFKIEKGQTSRTPIGNSFQWDHSMICVILRNPVYTGDMVYDKYDKKEVCGRSRLKPRSEWNIYKNHHAAIVSREDFEKVQKRRKQPGYQKQNDHRHRCLLQGKVFCGGCNRAMTFRKRSLHSYFYCNRRYVYAEPEKCVCHVSLRFLEQFVLQRVESELSVGEYLEKRKAKEEAEIEEKITDLMKNRVNLAREKAVLLRKRMKDYEKSVFDEDYEFCADSTVISEMEQKIAKVECEMDGLREDLFRMKNGSAAISQEGEAAKPTMEQIVPFIQKMTVYDEENIEIEWNYSALTSNTEPVRSSS